MFNKIDQKAVSATSEVNNEALKMKSASGKRKSIFFDIELTITLKNRFSAHFA